MREPVFISVRPGGRTIRYTKVGRRWVPTRDNPVELKAEVTGTDLLLMVGGIAALGIVGYFIWVSAQDAQAQADAAAADGFVGGNANPSTVLGPAGPQWLGIQAGAEGISATGIQPNYPINVPLVPTKTGG